MHPSNNDPIASSPDPMMNESVYSIDSSNGTCLRRSMTVVTEEPTRRKRTIRFSRRTKTKIYYKHEATSDLWLNKRDNPKIKRQQKASAAAWQQKKQFAALIQPQTFTHPDLRKLETFALLSGEDCMRGLENYVCRDFETTRLKYRKDYAIAMIDLETELKQQGDLSVDDMMEKMATFSRQLSKVSTHFARMLARADEYAARSTVGAKVSQQSEDDISDLCSLNSLPSSSSSNNSVNSSYYEERMNTSYSMIAAGVAVGFLGVASTLVTSY